MKIELLEDLYKQQIVELYDAERIARRYLNKMARLASTPELQQLFRRHSRETKGQLNRLETIMGRLGAAEQTRKSKAMAGLFAEVKELVKKPLAERELMDSALALAGQKVEAFEMFLYGALSNFARLLNFHTDLELLGQTLAEEKRMSERLTGLFENLSFEAAETEVHRQVA